MTNLQGGPSTAARLAKLEADVLLLKQKVAKLSTSPTVPGDPVYDANVLANPGFESGLVGWRGLWLTGGAFGDPDTAAWGVTSDALTGLQSAKMISPTWQDWTQRFFGDDPANELPVTPGDVWAFAATFWHDHPSGAIGGDLALSFGTNEGDAYLLFDPDVEYVPVADPTVPAHTAVQVSGEVTVPVGRSWMVPMIYPEPPAVHDPGGWTVRVDSVSLRRKLT